jgi:hypothetical protein
VREERVEEEDEEEEGEEAAGSSPGCDGVGEPEGVLEDEMAGCQERKLDC